MRRTKESSVPLTRGTPRAGHEPRHGSRSLTLVVGPPNDDGMKTTRAIVRISQVVLMGIACYGVLVFLSVRSILHHGGYGTDQFMPGWCGNMVIDPVRAFLNTAAPLAAFMSVLIWILERKSISLVLQTAFATIALVAATASACVFLSWFYDAITLEMTDLQRAKESDFFTLSKQVWWYP